MNPDYKPHPAKRWICRGEQMDWYTGHPDRSPCYCLATGPEVEFPIGGGEVRRGPRFLLAMQPNAPDPMTWRLWDSAHRRYITGDLGRDRKLARISAQATIVRVLGEEAHA